MAGLNQCQAQAKAVELLGPGATVRQQIVVIPVVPDGRRRIDLYFIELDGVIRGTGSDWADAVNDAVARLGVAA